MNAIALELPQQRRRVCWPCLFIWAGGPLFWVGLLAWWVL